MTFRSRLGPLLLGTIVLIALAVWRFVPRGATPGPPSSTNPVDAVAALGEASGWVNGDAVPPDSLHGHVVVLLLFSATEPMSPRALGEAEAWRQAYGPFGLRVVGVHVPEYSFAADTSVPMGLLRRSGCRFPVALDGSYRIASRLGAQEALPTTIVVGADGGTMLAQPGEDFGRVQSSVVAAMRRAHPDAGFADEPEAQAAPAPSVLRVFCGTSRATAGPVSTAAPGQTATFTAEFQYQIDGLPNTPFLVGRWTTNAEGVTAVHAGAAVYVAVRSEGGEVSAVLGPPPGGRARFWIMEGDGWLKPDEMGEDVGRESNGSTWIDVDSPRLYSLARGQRPRTLKLSPEQPGGTVYEVDFVKR